MSPGSGHLPRRWVSAAGEIGKGKAETGGAKVQKGGEVLLLLRVADPQLCFISPRVTVAQLVFVTSWVFIFLIPVLCSHFSWFALVLTPSFSPPHSPPLSSLTPIVECVCLCVLLPVPVLPTWSHFILVLTAPHHCRFRR